MRNSTHSAEAKLSAAISQYRADRRALMLHIAAWPPIFECLSGLIEKLWQAELTTPHPDKIPAYVRRDAEIAFLLCVLAHEKRQKLKRKLVVSYYAVLSELGEYYETLVRDDQEASARTRFRRRYPAVNSAMAISLDDKRGSQKKRQPHRGLALSATGRQTVDLEVHCSYG